MSDTTAGLKRCEGCTLYQRVHDYLMQPFTSAASQTEWVLFVGLIIIVAFLWTRILKTIEELWQ